MLDLPDIGNRAALNAKGGGHSSKGSHRRAVRHRGFAIHPDEEVSMINLDQVAAATAPDRQEVDLQWFRHDLEDQRRFRLDQLIGLTYDAQAAGDDASSEVNAALTSGARAALADIDAALFRLAIGTFGACRRCGRAIPADHLRAVPTATLCLRCHVAKEAANPAVHLRRTGTMPATPPRQALDDIVEIWGEDSFPASDPPANW
jgi:RNA polymerase-binding transcription factor DksA